jgi:hypothetical protein
LTKSKYVSTFAVMRKPTTRDRNKRRVYRGEGTAQLLLEWLNGKTESELRQQARFKVEEFVKSILQLEQHVGHRRRKQLTEDLHRAQTQVNVTLTDYLFVQTVDYVPPETLNWALKSTHDHELNFVPGESEAVACAVDLARQGLLAKVRKCACGEYFFARTKGQRHHSKPCRVEFWEKSPERKSRKREQAKRNYRLHKSGKVK